MVRRTSGNRTTGGRETDNASDLNAHPRADRPHEREHWPQVRQRCAARRIRGGHGEGQLQGARSVALACFGPLHVHNSLILVHPPAPTQRTQLNTDHSPHSQANGWLLRNRVAALDEGQPSRSSVSVLHQSHRVAIISCPIGTLMHRVGEDGTEAVAGGVAPNSGSKRSMTPQWRASPASHF
jgi:hypothetical protein